MHRARPHLVLPHNLISENDNASVYMNKVLVHGRHETEWVTISKDEYDSMNRTIEVLADKDIMVQIKKGKAKKSYNKHTPKPKPSRGQGK